MIVVHGWKGNASSLNPVFDALNGLVRNDTNWVVQRLDWGVAASALHSSNGLDVGFPHNTQARRVGKCLGDRLLAEGFETVHLVGHSLGAWVIDGAADKLTPAGVKTHLTFLDAYVPNPISENAGKLGDNATFAEHYVDRNGIFLGGPFSKWLLPHTDKNLPEAHNFDVSLLGPFAKNGHGHPIDWYAASLPPSNEAKGIRLTREYAGTIPSQDEYPEGETTCLSSTCPRSPLDPKELDRSNPDLSDIVARSGSGTVVVTDDTISLTTGSPAWIQLTVSAVAIDAIEFDLELRGQGVIQIYLDEELIFVEPFDGSEPAGQRSIQAAVELNGSVLALRLDPLGSDPATAILTNVAFLQLEEIVVPPSPTATESTTPATGTPDAPQPPNTGTGTAPFAEQPAIGGAAVVFLAVFAVIAGGRWAVRRPRGG